MKSKSTILMLVFVFSTYLLSAQGLTVEPKTNIKVLTGTTLNISSGDLLLKSDATGDATVMGSGSITHAEGSKAIVQRYMKGPADAWQMVSSPVNGMAITGSTWAPTEDDDFYLWDEPEPGTWRNYKNSTVAPTFNTANGGDNFVSGHGYLVSYDAVNPTKNFESTALNAGSFNLTLVKSDAKSWNWAAGWNLIGNPYAAGLDWSKVTKTNIVTETYAGVYNPNKDGGEGYDYIDGVIAPGQGFFVQAASNNVVLALTPSQQTHVTDQTFLKNSDPADKLVLLLSSELFSDETKILLNEDSSLEHDFYDATKFFSFNPAVPQLYSYGTDGCTLAINSIDAITETLVIPLSIKVQGTGEMTINLTEIAGQFDGPTIILQDLLTNTEQKLTEEPTYSFVANADDEPQRFLLKFSATGVDEVSASTLLHAYVQNKVLYILNPDAPKAQVELYDMSGQRILNQQISQGLQTIPVNISTGAYVVVMRTERAVATRKVVVF